MIQVLGIWKNQRVKSRYMDKRVHYGATYKSEKKKNGKQPLIINIGNKPKTLINYFYDIHLYKNQILEEN